MELVFLRLTLLITRAGVVGTALRGYWSLTRGKVFASCQEIQDPGMSTGIHLEELGQQLPFGVSWRISCSGGRGGVYFFLASRIPREVLVAFVSCCIGGL